MYNVDEIKDRIEFYKNAKKTRPGYKRALEERARIQLTITNFLNFLKERVVKDEYRSEVNFKIDLYNELLFAIDVYILESKVYLNIK